MTQAFKILAHELQSPFVGLIRDVSTSKLLDDFLQPLPVIDAAPFNVLDQDVFPAATTQPVVEAVRSQRKLNLSTNHLPQPGVSSIQMPNVPLEPSAHLRSPVQAVSSRWLDHASLTTATTRGANAVPATPTVETGPGGQLSVSGQPTASTNPEASVASIEVVGRLTEQIFQLIQGTAPANVIQPTAATRSQMPMTAEDKATWHPIVKHPLPPKISPGNQSDSPVGTTPQQTIGLIAALTQTITVTSSTFANDGRSSHQPVALGTESVAHWSTARADGPARSPRQSTAFLNDSNPSTIGSAAGATSRPDFNVDEVTDLVNKTLTRQARRYGVDLS